MDLFLHIGTEKTGTTSIQKCLKINRDLLRRSGVLYPVTPGNENHSGLTVAAQEVTRRGQLRKTLGVYNTQDAIRFRGELTDGLKQEFASGTFSRVIMSGEHCSSRLYDDEEVAWLRDLLSPFFERMQIVVYIRRQDDYLLSTYSTSIKSGATAPLGLPPQKAIDFRYDHWRLLSRWARVFGRENIICRRFEKTGLTDGDVLEDFLDLVGLRGIPGLERPPNVNESLDAESLEFLRLFNQHIPRFDHRELNPDRDNIVRLLSKMSSGPLATLGERELVEFMGLFRDSNEKVAAEYFGGPRTDSDDPLFAPSSDSRPRIANATLTAERAVEICAKLWQEKQAQIERIAERARRNRAAAKGAPPGRRPRHQRKTRAED